MRKISMTTKGLVAASAALLMSGLPSTLSPPQSRAAVTGDKETAAPLKVGDRNFVLVAASGGMAEVDMGLLAKERGQSEIVKMLSQHMVDEHSKLNNELSQLASKKGVAMPAEPMLKHKSAKDALAKLSGAAFDKQYVREMVKAHETDVATFEKEAANGKDADLVVWVKQSLPTLQNHLAMARDAEAKLNKSPNTVDKPPAPAPK